MSVLPQDRIRTLLEQAVESHVCSGYQLFVQCRKQAHEWCGGVTSYWPGGQPVTQSTYFDIGSVTKAVVTTSALARAIDQGKANLAARVGDYVQGLKSHPLGALVLRDLASHQSGLKPWLPLYQDSRASQGFLALATSQGKAWLEAPPGKQVRYSDLGFLLLGEVLQSVWNAPLEQVFQQQVCEPLALQQVVYGPLQMQPVADTEVRAGSPLRGEVFDENSQALGAKTAHAGLFATARGLAPWCTEWVRAWGGKSQWLSEQTARLFTKRVAAMPAATWALGWDTPSAKGSSAGTGLGPDAFGHLGYPGCSVWLDPRRQAFVILFTNRVHPSRLDERIRELRPAVHDAVAALWEASKEEGV